jgi:cobalt ECF transporter T component CbiQ
MRLPRVMMKLFIYAQVFVIAGALIFTIVTSGETIMAVRFLGITINFTDAGASLALLLYARATAALLLMFSFAASTPVPHLAAALKTLRLPNVFTEMMVLIYRYTFLLMESAEKMHLAAECRFGYHGYNKSIKTSSKLAVGVFMRSLDTAEKGQSALQCRNYRGEFRMLSEYEKQNRYATVFCAFIVCAAAALFFALRNGVLLA